MATADPMSKFNLDDGEYHSEFSYVCRFALGVSVYAGKINLNLRLGRASKLLKVQLNTPCRNESLAG